MYLHMMIRYKNLGLNSLLSILLGLHCLHHRVPREVGSHLACVFGGSVPSWKHVLHTDTGTSPVYSCLKALVGMQY